MSKKSLLLITSLLISIFLFQPKVFALTGPTVSISVPASASGVITIPVSYSFPDDNGKLYVVVSAMQVRPLDTFITKGSSGTISLTLDTTYWPDGTHTITAVAYYINSPLSAQDGPYDITTNNTPQITVNSPVGSVRGNTEFNLNYRFPSSFATYGLFWFYLDGSGSAFKTMQIPLSSSSPTEANLQFNYDTTYWQDGPHTIKVVARMGICFGCEYRPNPNIRNISITTDNAPQITITSPSGTVRGVVEFNIPYTFPSATTYGLFWVYLDNSGVAFKLLQIPLSTTSPTEGTWQFTYDTTYWTDDPHTIKVIAKMGLCHTCSAIRPPSTTQESNITTDNLPMVKILSPSVTIRGVVNASISYDFPSTGYSLPAYIRLERQTILGIYSQIAYKSVYLSPTQSTTGTWNFSFDVSNWVDGDYTLRAKAEYRKTSYDYMLITVANRVVEIRKDQQTPFKDITTVAEPINVANGNMFTSQTDILIPSKEIPLELSRTYNSQDDFAGSFGVGFRSNFDITLAEQPDQSVIEVDEKGVYTIYTKNPDGSYTPSAGKYSTLTKNLDGTFSIVRKHGKNLYFDNQGRLTKIEERNGNYLNILRTSTGIISEVSDSSSRKLLFTQDDQGKITQVTDPAGRIFKYEYDSSGNLIKKIDPLNNETLYQYDNDHNLIQQTDANNHSLYFEYDQEDRAYHSWQDGNNNEVTLSFGPTNKTTTATDSLGNITKYEYNDYGLVTKITDSQNNIQTFSWDANLNKTSATDQNGNTTTFTYDSRGNLLSIKDPQNNTTTFTYEPNFDLVSSITDALGNRTEYVYDAKGNLVRIEDALGGTTNYSYDTQGQLIQTEDANGNITNFNYDSYGNLIQITDSLNNQTIFNYDIIGNVTQITDAKANSTQFSYDPLNQLIQITYPDNSKVTYTYDAVGNLTSFIDPNNHSTTYTYDVVNRLIQVTDVLGNITQYTYDTEGNRLSIIDANLNKTPYFYDSLNRLIKTIGPLNNQTLFNYDPAGNLISKTNGNGNTINYTYDKNNRLTQIAYPDGSKVLFTYDALGRRTSMTDSTGTTTYSYDGLSRLTRVDGPQVNDTVSYAYDKLGNRIQMINQDGGITTYAYDSLNRLTNLTDPQGRATIYSYDALSNLTQMSYPNHTQANYAFDSLNRLISLTNKAGADTISSYTYDYNPSGMRTKVTLANHDYILYSYDNLNQLTQEKRLNPNNELLYSLTYTYDPLGNRLSQEINFKDEDFKIKGSPKEATLEYIYNPNHQLTQLKVYKVDKKGKTKLTKTIDFTYDQNGNLIQEITQDKDSQLKETIAYTYDYENRLSQIKITKSDENETKTFNFTYDGLGRRTSQTITEIEEVKSETKTCFYLYDGLNAIIERDQTNQTLATYTRGLSYGGGIGGITGIRAIDEEEDEHKELYYHYDGLGSVTDLTDTHAKPKITYTYDAFGNILNQKGSRGINSYTFSTKEQDKSGLIYFGARYYDPRIGRWITKDPLTWGPDDPRNFLNLSNALPQFQNFIILNKGILAPEKLIEIINLGRFQKEIMSQIGRFGSQRLLYGYLYCSNNPVNFVDPWGLTKKPTEININLDIIAFVADLISLIPTPYTAIGGYAVGEVASIANVYYTGIQYQRGRAIKLDVWVSRITAGVSTVPGPIGLAGSTAQLIYDLIRQKLGP